MCIVVCCFSDIISYLLLFAPRVFFRVLPCVIAALVYYAVFFCVRLLLSAYYDSLVPDPGGSNTLRTYFCDRIKFIRVSLHNAVLRGVSVL